MTLLASCSSNQIFFDMEQQSVVRCEGVISKLYLESKDGKDCLCFSISQGKKGRQSFSIKEIDKDYSIEVLSDSCYLNLRKFKLRPQTEYKIVNHSNGDATDGELLIRTGEDSSVVYADRTSCH